VAFCFLLQVSISPKLAAAQSGTAETTRDVSRIQPGTYTDSKGQQTPMAIIDMSAGDTHLNSTTTPSEGRLSRWFDLQMASLGTRYRFSGNSERITTANQLQYQATFKGRVKLDRGGRLSLNASVSSGGNFMAGWNRTGWGTGMAQTNLFLKQLYFSARPAAGVEVSYGGLDIPRDESTDITSYTYEGYIMGERVRVNRPRDLFFDEVSVTYGYLGDLNSPGVSKRFHRLRQSNFHRFILAKRIGERARASADYTFESGVETIREAVRVHVPELRLIDMLHFEAYQIPGNRPGHGLAVYSERAIHRRLTIGGGYSQVDRHMLNSDRYGQGNRIFFDSHLTINQALAVQTYLTHAVAGESVPSPRNRFDVVLSYNLLHHLVRTGMF